MSDLSGLSAIVTGGASGIGAAITARLRADGADVAVFDLDPGDDPHGYVVDVSDDDAIRNAVARVADRCGGIDIVVNNAGIGAQGTIEGNPDAQWHRVYDVNVLGAVRVSRAALPWLRRSPHAAIVTMGSIAAGAGLPDRALYSATKGALVSLTLAMAADHLHEGIRVNAVNPGTADTPWVAKLLASADDPDAALAALRARQPHGRLVSADEVADAVAYLVAPGAGSTTGTVLAVDGGMSGLRLPPRS